MLGQLLAEQRAELVTDDAIEKAAGFLGANAVHINGAGMIEGVLDRRFGDLIKGDALRFCRP